MEKWGKMDEVSAKRYTDIKVTDLPKAIFWGDKDGVN